jgi:hypothetical protein
MSKKNIVLLTASPFILFILYSQTEYGIIKKQNEEFGQNIHSLEQKLKSNSNQEMNKIMQSIKETEEKSKALLQEAEDILNEKMQVAKRNKEFRDQTIKKLNDAADDANRSVVAYIKNVEVEHWVRMSALADTAPKKKKTLEDAIDYAKKYFSEYTKNEDIEFRKALKEANKALFNIKNNF